MDHETFNGFKIIIMAVGVCALFMGVIFGVIELLFEKLNQKSDKQAKKGGRLWN